MTKTSKQHDAVPTKEPIYYLWQLLESNVLNENKDVLTAILSDNEKYTLTEAKQRVEKFKSKEVQSQ